MQAPQLTTDPATRVNANDIRNVILTEIGTRVAESARDAGHHLGRDLYVAVGNGSADKFEPHLSLANGQPTLAYEVGRGALDAAFANPSALLTQAYRGTGYFSAPLPVRALAVYPSLDRALFVVHPRLGITSLRDIAERHTPIRLWVRDDPTHATRILLDQILIHYGFKMDDVRAWGGSVEWTGTPRDPRRKAAFREGTIDVLFDEGIVQWFDQALASGLQPLPLEGDVLAHLESIGWRRAVIQAGEYPHLERDHECIDFSGWPLYTHAWLSDEAAYQICAALEARQDAISWEDTFGGVQTLGQDSAATPLDVPLHPGAERWYRENSPPASRQ